MKNKVFKKNYASAITNEYKTEKSIFFWILRIAFTGTAFHTGYVHYYIGDGM